MKTYKIETDEENLRLISKALDFYSRVGAGQFKEIMDHPTFQKHLQSEFTPKGTPKVGEDTPYGKVVLIKKNTFLSEGNWGHGTETREFPIEMLVYAVNYSQYHRYRDMINDILYDARNLLYFDTEFTYSGHWGIYNDKVDDTCRQAYDLHQIIRHEFWKENPNRSNITVDSHINLSSNKTNLTIE